MTNLRNVAGVLVFASASAWAQPSGQPSAPTTSPAANIEPGAMTPQGIVKEERLMEALRALPTKRAANSDVENVKGLEATEALIVDRLKAMGLTPRLEAIQWEPPNSPASEKTPPQPHEWHNVIVEFPGTERVFDVQTGKTGPDSTNSLAFQEVIMVGAHFDAVPLAPGADDNGSGVAALLELARTYKVLQDAGWTHKRTIRLAFFNLEEVALAGSTSCATRWRVLNLQRIRQEKISMSVRRNYMVDDDPDVVELHDGAGVGTVRAAPVPEKASPPERISLMLSLECLGYFSDAPGSQHSPFKPIPNVFEPPTVGDNIVLVTIAKHQASCKELGEAMVKAEPTLKVFRADFSPLPLPDLMRSDHAPFVFAGIPAIMVTDTANFRNPNYHKPTDTVETIDAKRFTLVAKGVAGAAWELAKPIAPEKH